MLSSFYSGNTRINNAKIAQLVEHSPEEGRVPSSNLGLGTIIKSARLFWLILLSVLKQGSNAERGRGNICFLAEESSEVLRTEGSQIGTIVPSSILGLGTTIKKPSFSKLRMAFYCPLTFNLVERFLSTLGRTKISSPNFSIASASSTSISSGKTIVLEKDPQYSSR